MTYYAHDGSSRGWISTGLKHADEFKSLGGDLEGMSVGANYGDGLYQVVTMNADQAGWGSAVPKGYEKVAYMDTDSSRDDITPGKALLRKIGGSLAKPEESAPVAAKPAVLDTESIAAARAKAEEVRSGSLASKPIPTPTTSLTAITDDSGKVIGNSGGPYDTIYNRGIEKQNLFRKMIDNFKANAFEQAAETGAALRFGLDSLDPSIKPTKIIDPWEVYERLKGDITA